MDTHLSERRGGSAGVAYRVLVALLAVTALLLAPAAASAHDTLSESSPSDGEVVPAPEEVDLTFTGEVGAIGTAVEVAGPEGGAVAGDPVVEGRTVTVPLVPDLPAGAYTVSWRVTSSDGHPISGEFDFGVEVEETTEPPTEPTPEPTTEPTSEGDPAEETSESATTTSSAPPTTESTDTDTAAPEATPVTAEGEGDGGGVSPWVWVLAGLVVVGLAGVVVAVARRSPDAR